MLKGLCCRCGTTYYGWALLEFQHGSCDKCGGKLTVKRDDSTRPTVKRLRVSGE